MRNSYFEFKQFTIHQEQCAMKVTTDGCLFGAYVSHRFLMNSFWGKNELKPNRVLDIGAGTGLLSLMYAQENATAIIDAIEIDENAAIQCQINFNNSPWKERLKIHCSAIQNYADNDVEKYALIISNPPFYEQQLKGNNLQKNTAHHSTGLTLDELFSSAIKLLKPTGCFILLIPFYRLAETIKIAEKYQLFIQQKILLKQTPKHHFFRGILVFSTLKTELIFEEIITIKYLDNSYTAHFLDLLKAYYLNI